MEDCGVANVLSRILIAVLLLSPSAWGATGSIRQPGPSRQPANSEPAGGPHATPIQRGLRFANAPAPAAVADQQPQAVRVAYSPIDADAPLEGKAPEPIAESQPEEIASPDGFSSEETPILDPSDWNQNEAWQSGGGCPAPTCSSGTWFNRGVWYARQDFVYMDRWAKDDVRLTLDNSARAQIAPNFPLSTMRSQRSLGFEPGAKFTLGRFLYRDGRNRDHSVEFSFFGLFDWSNERGITARADDSLFTYIDPNRRTISEVGGFNEANQQTFLYKATFDSFETNYIVASRLGRDRLEMTPQGNWVRRMTNGCTQSCFAGVRAISYGEGLAWNSVGTNPTPGEPRDGHYSVVTHNDMVGPQFGYELMVQRAKFRVGFRGKLGVLVNYADQHSRVTINDSVIPIVNGQPGTAINLDQNRNERANSHDLTGLGELNLIGAYHFRPNMTVRVGYDLLWMNQLVLAPEQLTFNPSNAPKIINGGEMLFNGTSLGLEIIW